MMHKNIELIQWLQNDINKMKLSLKTPMIQNNFFEREYKKAFIEFQRSRIKVLEIKNRILNKDFVENLSSSLRQAEEEQKIAQRIFKEKQILLKQINYRITGTVESKLKEIERLKTSINELTNDIQCALNKKTKNWEVDRDYYTAYKAFDLQRLAVVQIELNILTKEDCYDKETLFKLYQLLIKESNEVERLKVIFHKHMDVWHNLDNPTPQKKQPVSTLHINQNNINVNQNNSNNKRPTNPPNSRFKGLFGWITKR